jgi:hypothetical protein
MTVLLWTSAAAAAPLVEEEVREMVREVLPLVEAVSGARFASVPEVVLADAALLGRVVFQEQRHLLDARGAVDRAEADELAERTARANAGAFAGKYGFLDGRLYVAPEGLEAALAIEGYPPETLRPALRVVLAHELVHALQDQQVDLDRTVTAAPTPDAVMALNCLVEGHAVWVAEQVGHRLGLGDAVEALADLLGTDTPLRRRMDPRAFQQRYVYGLGRDAIAWHAARGGTDAVWAVLADPPTGTAQVVAPWSSAPDGPPLLTAPDRRTVLRASERLAGRGWVSQAEPLGDFDLRDQLVRAGADQQIADALRDGFNARRVGGAMAGVEVQVLRFDDDAGARAFVQGMRRQAEAQAEAVGPDPFISAVASGFDRVRADSSGREAITVRLFDDAVERLGKVWVARGPHVVQVVLVNSPATDRQVASSIESVFRALE